MKKDRQLGRRVLTAAIMVPLVVMGVLYLPTYLFAAILAVFIFLGALEWERLGSVSPSRRYGYAMILLFSLFPAAWLVSHPAGMVLLLGGAVFWWTAAAGKVIRYAAHKGARAFSSKWHGVTGFLVLVPAWAALVALHGSGEEGPWWVLFLMILIWSADTGAYFAGRKWGKNPLAPRVSPGKSWQGVWGGLGATGLAALVFGSLFPLEVDYALYFLAVCVLTFLFSVIGDLTESMFKRDAGVKDSGTLFPGHGGVLDRIDSLTAAAPLFALAIKGIHP